MRESGRSSEVKGKCYYEGHGDSELFKHRHKLDQRRKATCKRGKLKPKGRNGFKNRLAGL